MCRVRALRKRMGTSETDRGENWGGGWQKSPRLALESLLGRWQVDAALRTWKTPWQVVKSSRLVKESCQPTPFW